ncbi:MAG TPA: hypothetical protein VGE74_26985 [Gemmata sp.]
MKVKGHGGYLVLEAVDSDLDNLVQHNAAYEVDTGVEIRETRSAGCQGWTEALPRVRRVNAATFRVAEDDVSYPQAIGFIEGAELTFWLKRGELDEYDLLRETVVESVKVSNEQQKARWVTIVCRHGRYERDVEAPVLPEPDPPPSPPPPPPPP